MVLPVGVQSRFKFTVGGKSNEATVKGQGADKPVTADFGVFLIATIGHQRLQLESMNVAKASIAEIKALLLDGPALEKAHFNLKERRNAASVHLMYPIPDGGADVEAFYCEVTAIEDPTTTFYMACGWHRGYFGMQVNSPTERRIIFSVWDSGNEAEDRKKVGDENRVKLMGKGEGVFTGDFGNEGTGGHSHLKTMWKTGEKQRFIVTAKPIDKTTIFSGYWFQGEQQKWMLISSWRAPKEGGWMRGVHSFSENFGGNNGHLLRKAKYGNQWIRTPESKWIELMTAKFSHDPTGRTDRFDRFMGVENGEFFLSHGGFVDGFAKYGDVFTRPTAGQPPSDLILPE